MKKILGLFIILLLFNLSSTSQIQPFLGIFDIDSCSFENQCIIVQFDTATQNIWQIGQPSKPFFDAAYSQPYVLVTDTINPYPNSNYSCFDLIFPNYYYFGAIVGFKHKFQTDTLIDGGYIEVSYDNGQSWTNVLYDDTVNYPMEFHTENLYTSQDTLKGGIHGFSGTSSGWIDTRIQWIWAYPIKTIPPDTLIMRFNFISDTIQTNQDGWMIDNILISYAELPGSIQQMNGDLSIIGIAPNPSENFTTIKFENSQNDPLTLTVHNYLGQQVLKIEGIITNQFNLDTYTLTSGLYVIQLKNNNGIIGINKLIVK